MFSATKVYDDMMIAVFNVVYTALPPIVLALFDKVRFHSWTQSLGSNLTDFKLIVHLYLMKSLGCE